MLCIGDQDVRTAMQSVTQLYWMYSTY